MKWTYKMSESKEIREVEADSLETAEVLVWNKEINSLTDRPLMTSIKLKSWR